MKAIRESRFTKPLNDYVTENYFETLMILFSAIVFVFFSTKGYIPAGVRIAMPWLLIFLITTKDLRSKAILLIWINIGLLFNVWMNFYVSANHGFMIAFIGLALMITCADRENGAANLQKIAVAIISILMGWALVQKLISPYYMSGNLIGSYLATGQMFKVMLSFVIPDWFQITHDNFQARYGVMAEAGVSSVPVVVPPLVAGLAMVLTYTALLSQAALEAIVLLRKRFGIWTHYAVLLFVLIIYSTRNENVFLPMNLILGFAMTDEETKPARLWYVLGIIYLLGMEVMGLRPGIII